MTIAPPPTIASAAPGGALAPARAPRDRRGPGALGRLLAGLRDPVERCWRTIAVTDRFEAWVVAWPVGGAIELHDHGRAGGVVVVASGSLVETTLHADADGGQSVRSTTVPTGEHVLLGPDHVHDIINEGPGPALSVHVYTPALGTMTFFDRGPAGGLVAVRTEHYLDGNRVG